MSDDEVRITLNAARSSVTFMEKVSVSIIRDGEWVGRMEILVSDPSSSPEVSGASG
jgi:hypothetical protein